MDVLKNIVTPQVLLIWGLVWGGAVLVALLSIAFELTGPRKMSDRRKILPFLLQPTEILAMIVAILGATAIYFILEFTRKGILQAGVVSLLYLAALVVTMVSTDVFARPKKKTDKTCLYVALGLLALITLLS
jgi:hypothetical protein